MSFGIRRYLSIAALFTGVIVFFRYFLPLVLPFLLGAVVSTAFVLLPSIRQLIQQICELADSAEYVSGPARVLIKCMLICFLSKTAADICVDCGQKLIASQIETAAKLTVIMVNIPLLVSIVSQLCTMVQI